MGATTVTAGNWVRAAAVVLVALLVQQALLDHLRIAGTHPDVMLLVAVAAGYVGGPGRGVVVGFGAGVVADLFLPTTFGMSALVGALLAYGIAVATSSLVRSSIGLQVVTGAAGTALGLCMYATLGAVLGYPEMITHDLVPALAVSTPVAAVLSVPAMRLLAWAITSDAAARRAGIRTRSL
jgi:rod shape-determining protein MreD